MSVLAQHGTFLLGIIKLLSAFYVAWLAVKVWGFSLQSRPTKIGMKTIFITTLFNPKSFVFATYIIPSIAFRELQSFTAAMLSVFVALLPLSFIWVACGKGIARQGKLQSRLWPMFLSRSVAGDGEFRCFYGLPFRRCLMRKPKDNHENLLVSNTTTNESLTRLHPFHRIAFLPGWCAGGCFPSL